MTVCFDRGGWSPALFADITAAGFDLLTWRKGPAPDVPADEFTTITCADDRGREHAYDLADTTITLAIREGPRKGQTVSLRQVTRRVPARGGTTRQIHALTSRTDLAAGEVCWRLTSRWREENYFRYARTHFALDALDSHAATPDDPARLVPNPAKKTAAAQVRHAEILAAAAEAQRDASLAALRNPAPGQPVTITNQMINALDAPVEAAWRELQAAEDAAAAVPARIRLGEIAPDMVRLEAEVKQITHAIRMAAYNAETALARALDGHYARAGDEAYALIREALTASGDICPGNGQLLIRLDPLTAPTPDPGTRRPLRPAQPDPGLLPGHRSRPALRGQTPPWHCMKYLSMSGVLGTRPGPARPQRRSPQAVPLHLSHELIRVRRQPGRRGGQHRRDEARIAPGRLPRHRVPPRVQAEGTPGFAPRQSRGVLTCQYLPWSGQVHTSREPAAPARPAGKMLGAAYSASSR